MDGTTRFTLTDLESSYGTTVTWQEPQRYMQAMGLGMPSDLRWVQAAGGVEIQGDWTPIGQAQRAVHVTVLNQVDRNGIVPLMQRLQPSPEAAIVVPVSVIDIPISPEKQAWAVQHYQDVLAAA